ncbi:MAG: hypothetical protein M5R36_10600 [Deltaproteobacteria bacterium]|nr:hypothetical protein [Deltaproteobacteria bacterium]
MSKGIPAVLAVVLGAIFIFASPQIVFALSFGGALGDPGSLEKVFTKSGVVLRGKITGVTYDFVENSEGNKIPYTKIVIAPAAVFVGWDSERPLEIFTVGGWFDDEKLYAVAGQAWYDAGDEVIVFHNDELYPFYGAVGGGPGLLRIVKEGDEEILLDCSWRPILYLGEEGIIVESGARCIPSEDRGSCEKWVSPSNADVSFMREAFESLAVDVEDADLELSNIAQRFESMRGAVPFSGKRVSLEVQRLCRITNLPWISV